MPMRLKGLLWLPADVLQWYLDVGRNPLLRLAINLLISAFGWILFVLLYQIF